MDLVTTHPPFWYTAAITAIYLYAVLSLFVAPYSSEPRVLAALPIIAGSAAGTYGVWELLRFATSVGETAGPIVRAAVAIESLTPLFHGAAVATFVSTVLILPNSLTETRVRWTGIGSLALSLGFSSLLVCAALMWYVTRPGTQHTALLEQIALFASLFTGSVVVLAVPAGVIAAGGQWTARHPRRWFIVFIVFAIALIGGLRVAEHRLFSFVASS